MDEYEAGWQEDVQAKPVADMAVEGGEPIADMKAKKAEQDNSDAAAFSEAFFSDVERTGTMQKEVPPTDFRSAMEQARARGDKEFVWNGKKRSTALASDAPAVAIVVATPEEGQK